MEEVSFKKTKTSSIMKAGIKYEAFVDKRRGSLWNAEKKASSSGKSFAAAV